MNLSISNKVLYPLTLLIIPLIGIILTNMVDWSVFDFLLMGSLLLALGIVIELTIINLTSDLVQIKGLLEFSRNDFNIGTGNWKNTTILKDKIIINSNLFLMKEN